MILKKKEKKIFFYFHLNVDFINFFEGNFAL